MKDIENLIFPLHKDMYYKYNILGYPKSLFNCFVLLFVALKKIVLKENVYTKFMFFIFIIFSIIILQMFKKG